MYKTVQAHLPESKGKLVLISTPNKDSFWHALAYATYKTYRLALTNVKDKRMAVNRQEIVDAIKVQLASELISPVNLESKTTNYEAFEFKESLNELIQAMQAGKLIPTSLMDYIAKTRGVAIEIYDYNSLNGREPTRLHQTPFGDGLIRLASNGIQYTLMGELSGNNTMYVHGS